MSVLGSAIPVCHILARVMQIPKYCVCINPRVLTTDPCPQADAVWIRCQSAFRFLTHLHSTSTICSAPPPPVPTLHTGSQLQRHVSNPSERGCVIKIQLTAAAAEHGHGGEG